MSSLSERPLASQEGLRSMESVAGVISEYIAIFTMYLLAVIAFSKELLVTQLVKKFTAFMGE
jgi:hypothetical protein